MSCRVSACSLIHKEMLCLKGFTHAMRHPNCHCVIPSGRWLPVNSNTHRVDTVSHVDKGEIEVLGKKATTQPPQQSWATRETGTKNLRDTDSTTSSSQPLPDWLTKQSPRLEALSAVTKKRHQRKPASPKIKVWVFLVVACGANKTSAVSCGQMIPEFG
mmetsp:Transcript_18601/g.43094  ORF Transcript_18601/g.43094 Transcript_18601/m.43094 type:complete len:159 (-) Transcript_18601:1342-1818(-)